MIINNNNKNKQAARDPTRLLLGGRCSADRLRRRQRLARCAAASIDVDRPDEAGSARWRARAGRVRCGRLCACVVASAPTAGPARCAVSVTASCADDRREV
jgi:hypothetical protein